jgi:hypothetical protein
MICLGERAFARGEDKQLNSRAGAQEAAVSILVE